MVGKTLGQYKILEALGAGGMGEVYLAEDPRLGREIAIKVLPSEGTDDPERRRRFEREAKALASLNHPNIVVIHSVESVDGVDFITMELVDGEQLNRLIPSRGLNLEEFFELAIPLVDAIAAAHEHGITHRDLKPSNVMVSKQHRVKVLDFGLAKLKALAIGTAAAVTIPMDDLTAEGQILGTVSYMSPEQAEGKEVDERSDLFSLGIMLYEMVTGVQPFRGDSAISVMSSIIKDTPPPVTELNGALPRHLGRIIRRCLEKDPERRYRSAKDLRVELDALNEEMTSDQHLAGAAAAVGVAQTPAARRAIPWKLVVPIAVLIATVSAVAMWSQTWPVVSPSPLIAKDTGEDFSDVEITTTQIADSIYMLQGRGGNMAVCIGDDGAFIVDDQFAPLTEKIQAAIAAITPHPVQFVINTHWHFDHTGGNENLGGAGAIIVSHENSRRRMEADQFLLLVGERQEAYSAIGLPKITFTESMRFHYNGETIDIMHLGPAHTDGDAVVRFIESNVMHTGDVFVRNVFPYIDQPNGGNVNGMITFVDRLAELVDDNTRIIPGHGRLSTRRDLIAYGEMLRTIRDRVQALMEEGMTLTEIIASAPTRGYVASEWVGANDFVTTVYDSLRSPQRP